MDKQTNYFLTECDVRDFEMALSKQHHLLRLNRNKKLIR